MLYSMTMIEHVPVGEITAEARRVRLSQVLLAVFLALPWLLGWLGGRAWFGAVIFGVAVRRGWRDGTGYEAPPVPGPESR